MRQEHCGEDSGKHETGRDQKRLAQQQRARTREVFERRGDHDGAALAEIVGTDGGDLGEVSHVADLECDGPILFLSIPAKEIRDRLYGRIERCRRSGVRRFRCGLEAFEEAIHDVPVGMDDQPLLDVEDIAARMRRHRLLRQEAADRLQEHVRADHGASLVDRRGSDRHGEHARRG